LEALERENSWEEEIKRRPIEGFRLLTVQGYLLAGMNIIQSAYINNKESAMNEMEKYLDAIEAAVESKDKKAIDLLEGLAAYVYQELYARSNNSSGEEQVIWDGMHKRARLLISKMANAGPGIWD
jgi:hypothetical protein